MRIIVTDNFNREHISDREINPFDLSRLSKADAEAIAAVLNSNDARDPTYYQVVEDDSPLYIYEP